MSDESDNNNNHEEEVAEEGEEEEILEFKSTLYSESGIYNKPKSLLSSVSFWELNSPYRTADSGPDLITPDYLPGWLHVDSSSTSMRRIAVSGFIGALIGAKFGGLFTVEGYFGVAPLSRWSWKTLFQRTGRSALVHGGVLASTIGLGEVVGALRGADDFLNIGFGVGSMFFLRTLMIPGTPVTTMLHCFIGIPAVWYLFEKNRVWRLASYDDDVRLKAERNRRFANYGARRLVEDNRRRRYLREDPYAVSQN